MKNRVEFVSGDVSFWIEDNQDILAFCFNSNIKPNKFFVKFNPERIKVKLFHDEIVFELRTQQKGV